MKRPQIALGLLLTAGCAGLYTPNHAEEARSATDALRAKRESEASRERAKRAVEAQAEVNSLVPDAATSKREAEVSRARVQRAAEARAAQPTEVPHEKIVESLIPNREAYERYLQASYYEQGDQADGLHSGDEAPEAFAVRMAKNAKELDDLGEPHKAKMLTEILTQIVQGSQALRANEAGCRKDKKCTRHRENLAAAPQICGTLSQIASIEDAIRTERANPAGVVSLTALHEMGRELQLSREQAKEQKAEFRDLYKREFPTTICSEIAAD